MVKCGVVMYEFIYKTVVLQNVVHQVEVTHFFPDKPLHLNFLPDMGHVLLNILMVLHCVVRVA